MAAPKDHPVSQLLNPGIKWPVCPHQHLSPFAEVVTRRGGVGRGGCVGLRGASQANKHIILRLVPCTTAFLGQDEWRPCPSLRTR